MKSSKAIKANILEMQRIPRASSAKLRVVKRTAAAAMPVDLKAMAVPQLPVRRVT